MKKANVAISIGISDSSNIWANGLNQNIAFLVQLLRASPVVGKVWLVQPGAPANLPPALGFGTLDVPLVTPESITYEVDVVLEFGVTLPLEWVRHVRALGAKIVACLVGHSYPAQAEVSIFERSGGPVFLGTPWHEVWTLPSFMKTSAPLLRTVGRVPVHAIPHIWSPMFLEPAIAQARAAGLEFGFKPGRRPWRLAIFEPNISVAKTCFIPMLVCDQAYRVNHDAVGLMMVLNTFHMKEHRTFNAFASHMDLTRDGKASYEPRLAFVDCMAGHRIDAVVAHQWESAINYAYYDALHGGYPLIHNSDTLRDAGVGFHYPGFEASEGAQALLAAWGQGEAFWQDYRKRAAAFVQRLAPDHPANIEEYTRTLVRLLGDEHEA